MYITFALSLLCSLSLFAMEDVSIGTAGSKHTTKVLFLGAGELGKGVVQEFQKLGIEVVAVDRYGNAPGMQVSHRSHVGSMLDRDFLAAIIEKEKPTYIVPEIEAINTTYLKELEDAGKVKVIPTANATWITMNRKRIRALAAEQLGVQTSKYAFAHSKDEFVTAVHKIGFPCVAKPNMSSSGKGQSVLKSEGDIDGAWDHAQTGARGADDGVIVEQFIDFDYEITQLTVRHKDGTSFCEPIGHLQKDGDYRESWQPHPMSDTVKRKIEEISGKVTDALGGHGIFGVELFVKGDEVYFSEVSPRPHDTGMVTFISQDPNEFALHARAILGLPIRKITQRGPSASCALLVQGDSTDVEYGNLGEALAEEDTDVHFFGKPEVHGERRMGVALARGNDVNHARAKARAVAEKIKVTCH